MLQGDGRTERRGHLTELAVESHDHDQLQRGEREKDVGRGLPRDRSEQRARHGGESRGDREGEDVQHGDVRSMGQQRSWRVRHRTQEPAKASSRHRRHERDGHHDKRKNDEVVLRIGGRE